jgi:hypothetical protein
MMPRNRAVAGCSSGSKRQGTGALQKLAHLLTYLSLAKRCGVRLSSAAFALILETTESPRPLTDHSRIARQQGNPLAESARGLAHSKSWRAF